MKKTKNYSGFTRGFTLIELMVVIAIIGVLTSIMMVNFSAAKSKSRDAKRISDLSQIQLALAGYFDRCGSYPADLGDNFSTPCYVGGPSLSSTFISKIPSGPNSGEVYNYVSSKPNLLGPPDDYFLQTTLENPGSASNNSSPIPSWYTLPSFTPSFTCYDATTPTSYCVGPK